MKDITDSDFKHGEKVPRDLELYNPGDYHDWFVQSDMFLSIFMIRKSMLYV